MSKKNKHQDNNPEQETVETTQENINKAEEQVAETIAEEVAEQEEELDELGKLKALVTERESQIENQKKEYLFLMAEFDNFRKRNIRERADLIKNAAESTLKDLLPIVDDFERGLNAIKDSGDTDTVKEGMELIYNKLVKFLEQKGVKAMETKDATFDVEFHEAVALIPTTDESMKGKILDTVEKGYMYNDKVLRHAKVVVCQ
ncbi:MAG: nucleotide exchange factor GrpE [Muribaculaceae bacterium]